MPAAATYAADCAALRRAVRAAYAGAGAAAPKVVCGDWSC